MYIGVVNIYKSKSKYIQYNNCIVKFGLVKYILYIYKGKFVVGCKVICIFEWKKKILLVDDKLKCLRGKDENK